MVKLQEAELLDNAIAVFTSDNGGDPTFDGNNAPLRGAKGSLFEGGVRSSAFVWASDSMMPEDARGTAISALFHITDWLPTLLGRALAMQAGSHHPPPPPPPQQQQQQLATTTRPQELDGVDQWSAILGGDSSSSSGSGSRAKNAIGAAFREEVVLNVNSFIEGGGRVVATAIRDARFKLILNQEEQGWFTIPTEAIGNSSNTVAMQQRRRRRQLMGGGGGGQLQSWLFDLDTDPNEAVNLIDDPQYADIVATLVARVDLWRAREIEPVTGGANDPAATVVAEEIGYWTPWLQ